MGGREASGAVTHQTINHPSCSTDQWEMAIFLVRLFWFDQSESSILLKRLQRINHPSCSPDQWDMGIFLVQPIRIQHPSCSADQWETGIFLVQPIRIQHLFCSADQWVMTFFLVWPIRIQYSVRLHTINLFSYWPIRNGYFLVQPIRIQKAAANNTQCLQTIKMFKINKEKVSPRNNLGWAIKLQVELGIIWLHLLQLKLLLSDSCCSSCCGNFSSFNKKVSGDCN